MLMLSLFQKKGVLLHTTLFLSLFSALLLEAEADVTPLRHSHIDFQQVFRNRSFCLYQPTGLEIIFNMTLLLISSLCSLGLIIHFAFIKGLGERPGDILFMVSIGDLLSTANQVMMNVYCLNPDNKFYDDNLLYTFSNYVDVIVENIVNFYYISFCIFHLLTLKRALKGPGIPSFFYHLAPLMMAGLFSYGSYAFKGLESVWFCFHGFGLTAEIILSVSKYVVLACMTLALAKQIKSYLPEYRKIYEVRLEFLDYYSKYLTTLRYVYIGKGIVGVVTSLLISHGLNENTSRMLNIAMLAGRMMTGTFPIILSLARFNDPLIKKYWNGIIHGTVKEEKTGEILDLTGKKGKLELASALIEKSLKIKPQLQQIRYCRKVQVVYSILSGIHYFWHMRETGKLPTNSKKRRISLLNEVKDSELRNEKFKVKHIIKMKNNHLKKEVPQIFNEIKSRGYNLAQGKFTCYAQEAFSEIIKLDKAENEITKSLDLKENLSRISGSGLNKAGKSGEFFFFSKDNKFVIKTICRKEVKTLLKILPKYIEHYKKNPHSFIVRIYGIFSFKVGYSYEKYHFILMRNLNDYPINWVSRKYDLKGSTVGRRTIKNKDVLATELHTFDTLKDLDFNRYEKKIPLDDQLKSKLLGVLKADVDFLKTMGLIDYSLILYIIEKKEDNSQEGSIDQTNCSDSTCDSETKEEHNPFTLMESRDGKLYYKIGIIDYLTEFGFRKRLEIFIKKLAALNPNHNISAQSPHYYGERFLTYLTSLFD